MTDRMVTFFPAEFTGIAQWVACTIHILCAEKRIQGWRAFALILFSLPVLVVLNMAHSEQPTLIWLMITICCLISMLIDLRLGLKEHFSLVIQHWCNALMQSEFAAALAWVVNAFLASRQVFHFPNIQFSQSIMAVVYIVVFIPIGIMTYRGSRRKDHLTKLDSREVSINGAIALGAYVLSNTSFILPDSIMGPSIGAGVLYVRMIADLAGMIGLFGYNAHCYALHLNVNMRAMEGLLNRQYEQYQQFKVNNEQMRQVYHDIKHFIHYVRSVSTSQKYESALQDLEETVANYETQYDTGNSVLDVVLSNKKMMCRSERIIMECFVDAREMDFLETVHICSIFGNALDNAIEYERTIEEPEKRLIKVSVFSENQFLMIHISNYCEERILTSSEDPKTTKENPTMHGYGIKGIRLAVENYQGHMTMKQDRNWFILSILIPIPGSETERTV